jgi:choice-of-anchor B domain-containing protein
MNTLESTNLNPSRNLGKRLLSKGLAILAISAVTGPLSAQTLCEAGYAGAHPCKGIDLMSVRAWDELGGSGGFGNGNDCWGWVKEEREFVLYGRSNGLAVVEVTDPVNPVYLANLPTHSSPNLWRDVKVYNNHAFIVSEAGGHGMQVLDLNAAIANVGDGAL